MPQAFSMTHTLDVGVFVWGEGEGLPMLKRHFTLILIACMRC